MLKLIVSNPSDFPRNGPVSVPWRPIFHATGILPEQLVLRDYRGTRLPAQVDPIDPRDPGRDVLTFFLHDAIPPGADGRGDVSAVVEVRTGAHAGHAEGAGPRAGFFDEGVRLANGRLDVWISLDGLDGRPWYAGAATSVALDGLEMLDALRGYWLWTAHDPEKRCMQIDRVRLQGPEGEEWPVFDTRYEVLSCSDGPVRAVVALATAPFAAGGVDPASGRPRSVRCRLYRVISLDHDADYLAEEVRLEGIPEAGDEGGGPADLAFTARYFAYMDMGLEPAITHFAHNPSWFTISYPEQPHQGYGFATGAQVRHLANPHPGFPLADQEHRSFSWEVGPGSAIRCLHLFQRGSREELAARTGHEWYLQIYEPLRATLSF